MPDGQPERFRIVTFEGRSTAARWRASRPADRRSTSTASARRSKASIRCRSAITRRSSGPSRHRPAAILIEPIQGEGGVRPVPPQSLRALRRLCDERGLLLIFDEVQTGVGRTGRLFAYEWSGVAPDVMAVAKGIGGGFPLGACLATAEAGAAMTAGTHGSTFGGNPLAMAVGNAVLDVVLAPGFLERVERMGLLLQASGSPS